VKYSLCALIKGLLPVKECINRTQIDRSRLFWYAVLTHIINPVNNDAVSYAGKWEL
jgi:hypothetical protein